MIQDFDFSSVINSLGGGRRLAKTLSVYTGHSLNEKTVYSWKQQGIPDRWKPAIIKLLVKSGLEVNKDLLPPGMTVSNFQDSYSSEYNFLNSDQVDNKNLII